GVQSITSGARERLAQYVAEGGGLILLPGDKTEQRDLNALYSSLQAGRFDDKELYERPRQFAEAELDHPLFQGLFEQFDRRAGFDSPSIRKMWAFQPPTGGVNQTLIATDAGTPILHESRYKDGRVYTFSLHPSLDWSDWPLKPSFAPLLFRTTLLATQKAQQQLSRSVADDTPYRLPAGNDERLKLVELTPNQNQDESREIIPGIIDRGGARLLQFDQAELQPGNYGLYGQDSLLAIIAFNPPDAESELAYPNADALESRMNQLADGQMRVMRASPEVIRSEVQQASFGFQLWQYFLLFALAMLLAEVLILRLMR
ncbi:MAG: hypothetical protein ACOCZ8_00435, partial [Bacteroidota bacterium]